MKGSKLLWITYLFKNKNIRPLAYNKGGDISMLVHLTHACCDCQFTEKAMSQHTTARGQCKGRFLSPEEAVWVSWTKT